MLRTLLSGAVLLVLSAVSLAEEPAETVIRLIVSPAPAPRPALKYQLLPELREMNPGNPVQAYLKCFMEQNPFFFNKESVDNREKWQTMPLKDLPLEQVRHYGGAALRQADYAARLDTPDWQILQKAKRDGISLLIPEVAQMRTLAAALKVRFRAEVAEGRIDDAIVTAKTLFALARHLGEHPTLIGDLVGIAIAQVALGPLEELLQQRGCPNLFWALTDLPTPFIDVRKGMQSERMLMAGEFAFFDDSVPMTEAQLRQAVAAIHKLMKLAEGDDVPRQDVQEWLDKRAKDETYVRAARQRLIVAGLAESKVAQFPAQQVVLLDEKLTFEVQRDEAMKVMTLPYWQAEPLFAASRPAKEAVEASLFGWLAPAFIKVRMAHIRLEQRISLLRCVEGLRLYAAEHHGRLPDKLTDVPLPLPIDPVTGKSFGYRLDGKPAFLHGTPPKGMEKNPTYNVRYRVTIRE